MQGKYMERSIVRNLGALLFSTTRLGSHVSDRLPLSRRFLIDPIAMWVDCRDLRAIVATALRWCMGPRWFRPGPKQRVRCVSYCAWSTRATCKISRGKFDPSILPARTRLILSQHDDKLPDNIKIHETICAEIYTHLSHIYIHFELKTWRML